MPSESVSSDTTSYQAHTPSPLNPASPPASHRTVSAPATGFQPSALAGGTPAQQRSISLMMEKSREHGEDSPVMNETLSVIDEHITDMNTPRSSLLAARGLNDSGSEYSSHLDHRLSYINGHETDEEERVETTKAEVLQWNPKQVAEHLAEIGVERKHCEVFKEQEISGEVLLGLDQASIFMREFDLGVVGRRLRTWHKIRSFQEDIQANERLTPSKRGGVLPVAASPNMSRKTSTKASVLPRIPNFTNHSNPSLHALQDSPRLRSNTDTTLGGPRRNLLESPNRPSAASVREFGHSRRHSSIDFNSKSDGLSFGNNSKQSTPPTSPEASHKKQPSLDRNWTMNTIDTISSAGDRASSAMGSLNAPVTQQSVTPPADIGLMDGASHDQSVSPDLDRGYLSGGDIEGRKMRKVLRKNYPGSATHSRQNSQNQDQKGGSITSPKRHSRFSSAGSIRDAFSNVKSSSPKLGGDPFSKFRSKSTSTTHEKHSPDETMSGGSPLVTNLEYQPSPTSMTSAGTTSESPVGTPNGQQPAATQGATKPTYRGKQDALLGVQTPSMQPQPHEQPAPSPVRTGSTTSGATPSLEGSTESPAKGEVATPQSTLNSATGTKRVKPKQETSAYQKGLNKVSPREAMNSCDYSGWMKKKSPKMTSTWKPRLFVLRGRRLGYYYSEDDTEEKGVIDISSHRVLPADNEFLTGLHATLTGAKSSPTSPANAQTVTMNATELALAKSVGLTNGAAPGGMFIFKLVPPRPGLSRAISFTKQMVHYFAVDNVKQGRLWMAALMKATIDRDESKAVSTTYNQKTISLSKAIGMKQRPPALMGVDEQTEPPLRGPADGTPAAAAAATSTDAAKSADTGLNIQGVDLGSSPRTDDETTPNANAPISSADSRPEPEAPEPRSAPLLSGPSRPAPSSRQSSSAALAPGKAPKEPHPAERNSSPAAASLRLVRSMSGGLSGPREGTPVDAAPAGAETQPTATAEGGSDVQRPSVGEALSSLG